MKKVSPILEKFRLIFSHKFFKPTFPSFFSQAPLKLYDRNFGHLATLAAVPPPIHPPLLPSLSLPSLSPLPSLAALQLTAQLAKYLKTIIAYCSAR
jgi:hypothetical protein